MKKVRKAIYERFSDSVELSGLVTGMYYVEADQNASYPYITFNLITGVKSYDSTNTFSDCLIQFNVFDKSKSADDLDEITESLNGLYNLCNLDVEDHHTLTMQQKNEGVTRLDGVFHYHTDYQLLFDDSSVSNHGPRLFDFLSF